MRQPPTREGSGPTTAPFGRLHRRLRSSSKSGAHLAGTFGIIGLVKKATVMVALKRFHVAVGSPQS